jgi:divalent metal cation (Fe/Co/Zn/Cd) transporter
MSIWKDPTSKNAYILSWVGVVLETLAAIVGIMYFVLQGSAVALVFGLENFVDVFSSVVVLWRFYVPGKISPEKEELLKKRELRASAAISYILLLLGIGVIAMSVKDLLRGEGTEYELKVVIAIGFFSVLVFGTLAVFKFHYARMLDSQSLYKDGVCSLIGTTLAAALFVNTLIIRVRPDLWWLDPFVAMVCGFAALIYGIQSLYVLWKVKRLPVFSCSWWFTSLGDAADKPMMHPTESSEEGTTDLEMSETKDKIGGATNFSEVV